MASLFSSAASAFFGTLSAATQEAKSWGKHINWVSFKEGQQMVKDKRKPAMIVFHKPWCRACKALRPRFANSKEIENMSLDFIMISVEEDDLPKSSDLSPDGSYIPRILFMDPEGNMLKDVFNKKGSRQYKYYYTEAASNPSGNIMKNVTNKGAEGFRYYYYETSSIVDSMKSVLKETTVPRRFKTSA